VKSTQKSKETKMNNPEIDEYGDKVWRNEQGQLHREDGPAIEWANGGKYWYLNGKRHREDGPALEYIDGSKSWYLNGQLHREDGPAVEYAYGDKYWYLNGEKCSEKAFNEKMKSTQNSDKNPDLNALKTDLAELFSQFEKIKGKISMIQSILKEQ
jgi:hypothetical protein